MLAIVVVDDVIVGSHKNNKVLRVGHGEMVKLTYEGPTHIHKYSIIVNIIAWRIVIQNKIYKN